MAIHSVYALSRDDPEARSWLAFFRRHGYAQLINLVIERVFWLEGAIDVDRLLPLLVNPLHQVAAGRSQLDASQGPIIEIAYRPAVTDPETPSILAGAHALGEDHLEFARLSKRYQFSGMHEHDARKAAGRFLYNKLVERIREPGESFSTLRPTGTPDAVGTISLAQLSDDQLAEISRQRSWYAPLSQMKVIRARELEQGQPHTDAEIEILVQSWSDHCYHTTWKSLGLLKRLSEATARIHHPLVVSAFRDNAGGLEFYDDWVVTIKGETHNFPSSIAPFGGVATKHGGVIRDTLGFGKGAYPIGGTTVMGTMDPGLREEQVPPGALHPQLILTESIRATAYYCNPMGIPMMHPIYRRHPGYAKCLALGHSIGIIPKKYAAKEEPRPGDVALLIGGETGRDGIHGATASSASMTGETLDKESAAVQIGHPITQRRFTSAIPLLRDSGCIRSITDLGAGGISCAAGEMGAETGIRLDLDTVPLKDQSLTAWEILLSESQERMLLAVPPEKLEQAQEILGRYDVRCTQIGEFTRSHRLEAVWRGKKVVDLEMKFLWGACPLDPVPLSKPRRIFAPLDIPEPRDETDWAAAFTRVLSHYHCSDQSAAGARFDTTVQARTVVGPYGGRLGVEQRMPTNISVSAPLHGKPYGVITTVAFNPFYGDIDPAGMAGLMVIEAVTKAVVAGGDYHEMVLCDNFYTPRLRPDVAWDLQQMVESIARLSTALGIPFISGKDSSSGTFDTPGRAGEQPQRIDVPPTLVVAAMGRVPDVSRIVTKDFKSPGNILVLVGNADPSAVGGTVYADSYGQRGDALFDPGDAASIARLWDTLARLHQDRRYVSASAIGEGGLALRLFEAALGSGLGATIEMEALVSACEKFAAPRISGEAQPHEATSAKNTRPADHARGGVSSAANASSLRRDGLLFGEFIGAVLLELQPGSDVERLLAGIPYAPVGRVSPEPKLVVNSDGKLLWHESIAKLAESWSRAFREVLE